MRINFFLVLASIVVGEGRSSISHLDRQRRQSGRREHRATGPSNELIHHLVKNEISSFGKGVNAITSDDINDAFEALAAPPAVMSRRRHLQSEGDGFSYYTLREIPIVYHVLPNQNAGYNGYPRATAAQLEYMTEVTNQMFNIYHKNTRTSVQFVSFTYGGRIEHQDFIVDKSCENLNEYDVQRIVAPVEEYEYKMHVLICEAESVFGSSSFPGTYTSADPRHNVAYIAYDAISCYDDEGTFLCEDAESGSHSAWYTQQSKRLAKEFGHLFGLYGTYEGSCDSDDPLLGGDGVPDTPPQYSEYTQNCPGLLPYDKDRDLFDESQRTSVNTLQDNDTCFGGEDSLCEGNTCASCCFGGDGFCYWYYPEDSFDDAPTCCIDNTPIDSCDEAGIDPLNNVMSDTPDYCKHELTPGQMMKMMAQVRAEKPLIYCNYVDFDDPICEEQPCSSYATRPGCDICNVGFRLWDTSSQTALDYLAAAEDGASIDLCQYKYVPMTIEAVATCADAGVTMRLFDDVFGGELVETTKSSRPYTLGNDDSSELDPLPVDTLQRPGLYKLVVDETDRHGSTVQKFEIGYFCGCDMFFRLWNTDLGVPIRILETSDIIDLCVYEKVGLSVEVVSRCSPNGVRFLLEDERNNMVQDRHEKVLPYTIAGNIEMNIEPEPTLNKPGFITLLAEDVDDPSNYRYQYLYVLHHCLS